MRRTKSGLPEFCSWHRDRADGKTRVRFRRAGVLAYIDIASAPVGSEAFWRIYHGLRHGRSQGEAGVGARRTLPGSINELIASYRKLVFPTLKETTQAMRARILENFGREHGDRRVAHLEHEHVAAIIAAKKAKPHAANNLRKVLRRLLDHAIEIRMIAHNPATRVKRLQGISHLDRRRDCAIPRALAARHAAAFVHGAGTRNHIAPRRRHHDRPAARAQRLPRSAPH
jgi:hypothetical protein